MSGDFTPPNSLAAIREFLAESAKDEPWILGFYGSPTSRGMYLQHHDDVTAGLRSSSPTEG